MNAELIAVGTEILLGDIVNTDAQLISQGLSELGINVFYQTVVGDNPDRLRHVIETARDCADEGNAGIGFRQKNGAASSVHGPAEGLFHHHRS